VQEFCCYEARGAQQSSLGFVMIAFQKMAIYFKIVSVVCKAVSAERRGQNAYTFTGFRLLAQVQKRIKTRQFEST